jgi:hypothetical protein
MKILVSKMFSCSNKVSKIMLACLLVILISMPSYTHFLGTVLARSNPYRSDSDLLKSVSPNEVSTGSLSVTVLDSHSLPLHPETIILYDSSYTEVSRVTPLLNFYTFNFLSPGTYNVEVYIDDMFIGAAGSVPVQAGQTASCTIQASWSEKPLNVTVYYSDGSTVLPGATVEVYSWDGYHKQYNLRTLSITDFSGRASFVLWPTTIAAEHYKLKVSYLLSGYVGEKDNVRVDKYSGGSESITTTLGASGYGSISVTILNLDGSPLTPDTLILYNSSYQEISRAWPLLNFYTFNSLSPGTYNIEAYDDDMFIGAAGNIAVPAGQTIPQTIQAGWSKKTLVVTVHYNDGTTALSGASVEVFSWDGHTKNYNLRQTQITNSIGKVSFALWPTTIATEHYELKVTYLLSGYIGEKDNVKVDEYNGGEEIITTTLSPSTPGLGSISITLLDSSSGALTPETLILYNSLYQEMGRATPLLNTYTFNSLSAGTYNVEAYVDDMFIGAAGNIIVQTGQTTSRTIQASWSKQTLMVTVYFSDGTTVMPGATVEVHSWDGYHQRYSLRSSAVTNDKGKASFLLWPTTITAERYKLEVTYSLSQIGEEDNVKVGQYSGGSETITTTLAPSPPLSERFSPTVNGYHFNNNIPKETVSFSDAKNALSSCTWSSLIPLEARPLVAFFAVGVHQLQLGNCFGMCYTAKYYYKHPSDFASKYSGFGDMYGVSQASASPEILVNQFPGQEIMQPYLFNLALTYLGLNSLNDDARWIMTECDNYRVVQLYLTKLQNDPFFFHSVLVYNYKLNDDELTLSIYDPNHSGTTCYITLSKDQNGNFALKRTGAPGDLVAEYGLTNIGTGERTAVDWNLLSAHVNELVQLVWELVPKAGESFLGTKVECPVNMLIRASNGSRVGYDWTTGQIVNELDGVFYSGNATEPQVIMIPDPDNGSYSIMLSGTSKGNYALTVERYDHGQLIGSPLIVNGKIEAGQLKEYTLQLAGNAGPTMEETPAGINVWWVGTVVALIVACTLFAAYYRKYRKLRKE